MAIMDIFKRFFQVAFIGVLVLLGLIELKVILSMIIMGLH